ncbi:helix-turn-helix domain-containing protein [Kribbella sp. NBC_00889]|uniref:helix-turn-helix domain-containing protein n=1 Tax=Kribbella sp. NBC_00889 TaxID=2975974 RepID=UPI00386ACF5E|nr:helix-turn-helix domain-containing protein [Kribbella sp. NBC_00889]
MHQQSGDHPNAKLLSIAEFAQVVGMSQMTIYRLISAGQMPAVRIGKRLFVPGRVIDDLSAAALASGGTVSVADWREGQP